MGYIAKNLTRGEDLIFKTKLHWWIVIASVLNAIIFTIILFACLLSTTASQSSRTSRLPQSDGYATVAWMCAGIFGIIAGIGALINVNSSEFGVTSRRVIMKTGIIRRKTLELNLNKIESIEVKESILGRILGFKAILLIGSGGTKQRFAYIADADIFKRFVVETMDRGEAEFRQRTVASTRTYEKPKNEPIFFEADIDLPREDTQQRLSQATQFIRTGNRQAAIDIVRELIQSDPQNADVWYLTGYLAKASSQKKQAYERALSINPRHTKAREALTALDIDLP